MRPQRIPLIMAAGAIALAGMSIITPANSISRNISASMDVGWYVRVHFAKPEPGSIVQFPIPERARALAKAGGMRLDLPLLKRVESITPDGGLIVKGDCGGRRSLDSTYFEAIGKSEIVGVYVPLPWTMTPCKTLVDEEAEEGKEVYRKEKIFEGHKAGSPQESRHSPQTSFAAMWLAVPQALAASCGIVPQICGRVKNA